jgi:proline dehydrogenase
VKALNTLIARTLPLVPTPLIRRFASRYVAGETLSQALEVVRGLNAEGCMATLDVLGEDITDLSETEDTVAEYQEALTAIARESLDSNVSVKLTALGLKLDPQECRRRFGRILETARLHSNFVRIDMEDSSVTQETLAIYEESREKGYSVGLVLQAYLRRSRNDALRAAQARANVRVCKGIYVEPPSIAYQGPDEIRESFAQMVDTLLGSGCYTGIATHDVVLVERARATIQRLRLDPSAYEFQMLLGVAAGLRRRLVASGHRLRVYVPYGHAWQAYSLRRLKENPAIAGHVLKNLFSGGR